MVAHHRSPARAGSDLLAGISPSLLLLGILLALCWLAGGASRADAAGQAVVRGGAWAILIVALLFCPRPDWRPIRGAAIVLLLAVLLAGIQLIPLPPGLWQSLPGRAMFSEAATASGQVQPWRPWAIVPAGAANALGSLIVPVTALVLAGGLNGRALRMLPAMVLAFIVAAMMVGLLQAAGAGFDNPFINDARGEIGGIFANRNHFALLLAMGCLLAPVWAFNRRDAAAWRAALALGLVLLFALTILASGSRAGMALGALAIGLGAWLSREGIGRALRHAPRWVGPALLVAAALVVLGFVALAVLAGRAESISRALALTAGDDMRSRALPTVWAMIGTYFPVGSGLGGFDPLFRMHEPFALLKPTYFNHVHNDFLEIPLEAGIPGLLLLLGAIGWWGWASVQAWRQPALLPRAGAVMILLVLIASVFDYPARTPTIMAILVVAAVWLGARDMIGLDGDERTGRGSALPRTGRHL